MAELGLNTADGQQVRLMAKRTGACLQDNRNKCVARSEMGNVYLAESHEVQTLVVEVFSKGEIGQAKE